MNRSSETVGRALEQLVTGEVLWDERTLTRFSTDMSMYQVRPLVVVVPQNLADVVAVVDFAREGGIPLTARGGGSSTAGSALGRGVILSFPRQGPMNQLVAFDQIDGEPRATVEPGLLHDQLQAFLRERGLFLPADPSSGPICVLGGNIATKASGPHALKHGSIDRYLRSLQFVTVEGEVIDTADADTIPARIRQGVLTLRDDVLANTALVKRLQARQDKKIASGYNLFTFIRHREIGNLVAQLLVGSVGTLGVITQATLRAEPYVPGKATTLLYFRDLDQAGDAVQHIKSLGVAAIEMMNHRSISIARARRPDLEAPDGEAHMLLVEYEGPERHQQIDRVKQLLDRNRYELALDPVTVEGEEAQADLWKIRKSLLPAVRGARRDRKALSLVNDVGVPVAHLADLIRDVEAIFERHNLVAAIYGHAGSGNLHLRPLFDPSDPNLPALLRQVADEVYQAVFRYDGTITAEHGMGRLRTPYLEPEWGVEMVHAMQRVKELFDPEDLLNPDVMFSQRRLTDDLREFNT
ncbi:MAG: FAD-binding oxidoreductase [Anaerolineae bacterium]|jgi:FAD/FMN-containing dehydrogenase